MDTSNKGNEYPYLGYHGSDSSFWGILRTLWPTDVLSLHWVLLLLFSFLWVLNRNHHSPQNDREGDPDHDCGVYNLTWSSPDTCSTIAHIDCRLYTLISLSYRTRRCLRIEKSFFPFSSLPFPSFLQKHCVHGETLHVFCWAPDSMRRIGWNVTSSSCWLTRRGSKVRDYITITIL
jgi:hypothetical protein